LSSAQERQRFLRLPLAAERLRPVGHRLSLHRSVSKCLAQLETFPVLLAGFDVVAEVGERVSKVILALEQKLIVAKTRVCSSGSEEERACLPRSARREKHCPNLSLLPCAVTTAQSISRKAKRGELARPVELSCEREMFGGAPK
jgi:hypothetical protein